MERQLCLVLDSKGEYRLVLEEGSSYEIDEYTSKYFEDSSQIRETYREEIDLFLTQYKELLQKSNNPNYEGRIVIVKPEKVGQAVEYYQKKVLYKKHIIAFNEFLKNKSLMLAFVNYEIKKGAKSFISRYVYEIVKYNWARKRTVTSVIKEWIKKSKEENKNYYEIIRDMLAVYTQEQSNLSLVSIDKLYSNYKIQKEEKAKERLNKRGKIELEKAACHTIVENSVEITEVTKLEIEEQKLYNINGCTYTLDELHLLDLEDIDETSEYMPDGAKKLWKNT